MCFKAPKLQDFSWYIFQSAEYFDTYNEIKALPEREIKLLLEEKDSRIRSLENFVN
jgi:hypothetical protein